VKNNLLKNYSTTLFIKKSKFMSENTNDSSNPVLTFEGKKYFINELSQDIKESIKGLQIAEKQLKMHEIL